MASRCRPRRSLACRWSPTSSSTSTSWSGSSAADEGHGSRHIVLVGDSILDNAAYVGGDPAVAEQLRDAIPADWRVTLAAVDGASAAEVASQLDQVDATATHL